MSHDTAERECSSVYTQVINPYKTFGLSTEEYGNKNEMCFAARFYVRINSGTKLAFPFYSGTESDSCVSVAVVLTFYFY